MGKPIRLFIQSQLTYEVFGESTFLLNIAAAAGGAQRICREQIANSQNATFDEVRDHGSPTRFHRFAANAGEVVIRYEAEVELVPVFHKSEMVWESTLADLPAHVIPFL